MEHHTHRAWIREHKRLLFVLLLILCDGLLLVTYASRHSGVLTVVFLDVGQGDAVYIEAPNGNQILYDAGPPSGAVLRALPRVMPMWDRTLDVAVFSHPDMDHIGGFVDVFKRYTISAVLEPGATSDNGVWDTLGQSVRMEHATHIVARKGMRIVLGGGVVAEILYPDHPTEKMETNSASVVLRLRYGDTSFLLSGDLPSAIEEYEVGMYGEKLESTVLKLGHHGSRTSSSPLWLSAVHPTLAVISAGRNNRYGHPHTETLERLKKLAIPFLGTYNEGTIVLTSDGKTVSARGHELR